MTATAPRSNFVLDRPGTYTILDVAPKQAALALDALVNAVLPERVGDAMLADADFAAVDEQLRRIADGGEPKNAALYALAVAQPPFVERLVHYLVEFNPADETYNTRLPAAEAYVARLLVAEAANYVVDGTPGTLDAKRGVAEPKAYIRAGSLPLLESYVARHGRLTWTTLLRGAARRALSHALLRALESRADLVLPSDNVNATLLAVARAADLATFADRVTPATPPAAFYETPRIARALIRAGTWTRASVETAFAAKAAVTQMASRSIDASDAALALARELLVWHRERALPSALVAYAVEAAARADNEDAARALVVAGLTPAQVLAAFGVVATERFRDIRGVTRFVPGTIERIEPIVAFARSAYENERLYETPLSVAQTGVLFLAHANDVFVHATPDVVRAVVVEAIQHALLGDLVLSTLRAAFARAFTAPEHWTVVYAPRWEDMMVGSRVGPSSFFASFAVLVDWIHEHDVVEAAQIFVNTSGRDDYEGSISPPRPQSKLAEAAFAMIDTKDRARNYSSWFVKERKGYFNKLRYMLKAGAVESLETLYTLPEWDLDERIPHALLNMSFDDHTYDAAVLRAVEAGVYDSTYMKELLQFIGEREDASFLPKNMDLYLQYLRADRGVTVYILKTLLERHSPEVVFQAVARQFDADTFRRIVEESLDQEELDEYAGVIVEAYTARGWDDPKAFFAYLFSDGVYERVTGKRKKARAALASAVRIDEPRSAGVAPERAAFTSKKLQTALAIDAFAQRDMPDGEEDIMAEDVYEKLTADMRALAETTAALAYLFEAEAPKAYLEQIVELLLEEDANRFLAAEAYLARHVLVTAPELLDELVVLFFRRASYAFIRAATLATGQRPGWLGYIEAAPPALIERVLAEPDAWFAPAALDDATLARIAGNATLSARILEFDVAPLAAAVDRDGLNGTLFETSPRVALALLPSFGPDQLAEFVAFANNLGDAPEVSRPLDHAALTAALLERARFANVSSSYACYLFRRASREPGAGVPNVLDALASPARVYTDDDAATPLTTRERVLAGAFRNWTTVDDRAMLRRVFASLNEPALFAADWTGAANELATAVLHYRVRVGTDAFTEIMRFRSVLSDISLFSDSPNIHEITTEQWTTLYETVGARGFATALVLYSRAVRGAAIILREKEIGAFYGSEKDREFIQALAALVETSEDAAWFIFAVPIDTYADVLPTFAVRVPTWMIDDCGWRRIRRTLQGWKNTAAFRALDDAGVFARSGISDTQLVAAFVGALDVDVVLRRLDTAALVTALDEARTLKACRAIAAVLLDRIDDAEARVIARVTTALGRVDFQARALAARLDDAAYDRVRTALAAVAGVDVDAAVRALRGQRAKRQRSELPLLFSTDNPLLATLTAMDRVLIAVEGVAPGPLIMSPAVFAVADAAIEASTSVDLREFRPGVRPSRFYYSQLLHWLLVGDFRYFRVESYLAAALVALEIEPLDAAAGGVDEPGTYVAAGSLALLQSYAQRRGTPLRWHELIHMRYASARLASLQSAVKRDGAAAHFVEPVEAVDREELLDDEAFLPADLWLFAGPDIELAPRMHRLAPTLLVTQIVQGHISLAQFAAFTDYDVAADDITKIRKSAEGGRTVFDRDTFLERVLKPLETLVVREDVNLSHSALQLLLLVTNENDAAFARVVRIALDARAMEMGGSYRASEIFDAFYEIKPTDDALVRLYSELKSRTTMEIVSNVDAVRRNARLRELFLPTAADWEVGMLLTDVDDGFALGDDVPRTRERLRRYFSNSDTWSGFYANAGAASKLRPTLAERIDSPAAARVLLDAADDDRTFRVDVVRAPQLALALTYAAIASPDGRYEAWASIFFSTPLAYDVSRVPEALVRAIGSLARVIVSESRVLEDHASAISSFIRDLDIDVVRATVTDLAYLAFTTDTTGSLILLARRTSAAAVAAAVTDKSLTWWARYEQRMDRRSAELNAIFSAVLAASTDAERREWLSAMGNRVEYISRHLDALEPTLVAWYTDIGHTYHLTQSTIERIFRRATETERRAIYDVFRARNITSSSFFLWVSLLEPQDFPYDAFVNELLSPRLIHYLGTTTIARLLLLAYNAQDNLDALHGITTSRRLFSDDNWVAMTRDVFGGIDDPVDAWAVFVPDDARLRALLLDTLGARARPFVDWLAGNTSEDEYAAIVGATTNVEALRFLEEAREDVYETVPATEAMRDAAAAVRGAKRARTTEVRLAERTGTFDATFESRPLRTAFAIEGYLLQFEDEHDFTRMLPEAPFATYTATFKELAATTPAFAYLFGENANVFEFIQDMWRELLDGPIRLRAAESYLARFSIGYGMRSPFRAIALSTGCVPLIQAYAVLAFQPLSWNEYLEHGSRDALDAALADPTLVEAWPPGYRARDAERERIVAEDLAVLAPYVNVTGSIRDVTAVALDTSPRLVLALLDAERYPLEPLVAHMAERADAAVAKRPPGTAALTLALLERVRRVRVPVAAARYVLQRVVRDVADDDAQPTLVGRALAAFVSVERTFEGDNTPLVTREHVLDAVAASATAPPGERTAFYTTLVDAIDDRLFYATRVPADRWLFRRVLLFRLRVDAAELARFVAADAGRALAALRLATDAELAPLRTLSGAQWAAFAAAYTGDDVDAVRALGVRLDAPGVAAVLTDVPPRLLYAEALVRELAATTPAGGVRALLEALASDARALPERFVDVVRALVARVPRFDVGPAAARALVVAVHRRPDAAALVREWHRAGLFARNALLLHEALLVLPGVVDVGYLLPRTRAELGALFDEQASAAGARAVAAAYAAAGGDVVELAVDRVVAALGAPNVRTRALFASFDAETRARFRAALPSTYADVDLTSRKRPTSDFPLKPSRQNAVQQTIRALARELRNRFVLLPTRESYEAARASVLASTDVDLLELRPDNATSVLYSRLVHWLLVPGTRYAAVEAYVAAALLYEEPRFVLASAADGGVDEPASYVAGRSLPLLQSYAARAGRRLAWHELAGMERADLYALQTFIQAGREMYVEPVTPEARAQLIADDVLERHDLWLFADASVPFTGTLPSRAPRLFAALLRLGHVAPVDVVAREDYDMSRIRAHAAAAQLLLPALEAEPVLEVSGAGARLLLVVAADDAPRVVALLLRPTTRVDGEPMAPPSVLHVLLARSIKDDDIERAYAAVTAITGRSLYPDDYVLRADDPLVTRKRLRQLMAPNAPDALVRQLIEFNTLPLLFETLFEDESFVERAKRYFDRPERWTDIDGAGRTSLNARLFVFAVVHDLPSAAAFVAALMSKYYLYARLLDAPRLYAAVCSLAVGSNALLAAWAKATFHPQQYSDYSAFPDATIDRIAETLAIGLERYAFEPSDEIAFQDFLRTASRERLQVHAPVLATALARANTVESLATLLARVNHLTVVQDTTTFKSIVLIARIVDIGSAYLLQYVELFAAASFKRAAVDAAGRDEWLSSLYRNPAAFRAVLEHVPRKAVDAWLPTIATITDVRPHSINAIRSNASTAAIEALYRALVANRTNARDAFLAQSASVNVERSQPQYEDGGILAILYLRPRAKAIVKTMLRGDRSRSPSFWRDFISEFGFEVARPALAPTALVFFAALDADSYVKNWPQPIIEWFARVASDAEYKRAYLDARALTHREALSDARVLAFTDDDVDELVVAFADTIDGGYARTVMSPALFATVRERIVRKRRRTRTKLSAFLLDAPGQHTMLDVLPKQMAAALDALVIAVLPEREADAMLTRAEFDAVDAELRAVTVSKPPALEFVSVPLYALATAQPVLIERLVAYLVETSYDDRYETRLVNAEAYVARLLVKEAANYVVAGVPGTLDQQHVDEPNAYVRAGSMPLLESYVARHGRLTWQRVFAMESIRPQTYALERTLERRDDLIEPFVEGVEDEVDRTFNYAMARTADLASFVGVAAPELPYAFFLTPRMSYEMLRTQQWSRQRVYEAFAQVPSSGAIYRARNAIYGDDDRSAYFDVFDVDAAVAIARFLVTWHRDAPLPSLLLAYVFEVARRADDDELARALVVGEVTAARVLDAYAVYDEQRDSPADDAVAFARRAYGDDAAKTLDESLRSSAKRRRTYASLLSTARPVAKDVTNTKGDVFVVISNDFDWTFELRDAKGAPAGYARVDIDEPSDTLWIDSVEIEEPYRGTRLCTPLVTVALQQRLAAAAKRPALGAVQIFSDFPTAAYRCYASAFEAVGYEFDQTTDLELPDYVDGVTDASDEYVDDDDNDSEPPRIESIKDFEAARAAGRVEEPWNETLQFKSTSTKRIRVEQRLATPPTTAHLVADGIVSASGDTFRVVAMDEQARRFALVAADGKVVGEAGVELGRNSIWIDAVHIDEAFRGQGLCTPLVTEALRALLATVETRPPRGRVQLATAHPAAAFNCYAAAFEAVGYVFDKTSAITYPEYVVTDVADAYRDRGTRPPIKSIDAYERARTEKRARGLWRETLEFVAESTPKRVRPTTTAPMPPLYVDARTFFATASLMTPAAARAIEQRVLADPGVLDEPAFAARALYALVCMHAHVLDRRTLFSAVFAKPEHVARALTLPNGVGALVVAAYAPALDFTLPGAGSPLLIAAFPRAYADYLLGRRNVPHATIVRAVQAVFYDVALPRPTRATIVIELLARVTLAELFSDEFVERRGLLGVTAALETSDALERPARADVTDIDWALADARFVYERAGVEPLRRPGGVEALNVALRRDVVMRERGVETVVANAAADELLDVEAFVDVALRHDAHDALAALADNAYVRDRMLAADATHARALAAPTPLGRRLAALERVAAPRTVTLRLAAAAVRWTANGTIATFAAARVRRACFLCSTSLSAASPLADVVPRGQLHALAARATRPRRYALTVRVDAPLGHVECLVAHTLHTALAAPAASLDAVADIERDVLLPTLVAGGVAGPFARRLAPPTRLYRFLAERNTYRSTLASSPTLVAAERVRRAGVLAGVRAFATPLERPDGDVRTASARDVLEYFTDRTFFEPERGRAALATMPELMLVAERPDLVPAAVPVVETALRTRAARSNVRAAGLRALARHHARYMDATRVAPLDAPYFIDRLAGVRPLPWASLRTFTPAQLAPRLVSVIGPVDVPEYLALGASFTSERLVRVLLASDARVTAARAATAALAALPRPLAARLLLEDTPPRYWMYLDPGDAVAAADAAVPALTTRSATNTLVLLGARTPLLELAATVPGVERLARAAGPLVRERIRAEPRPTDVALHAAAVRTGLLLE